MESPCYTCRYRFFSKSDPWLVKDGQANVINFLAPTRVVKQKDGTLKVKWLPQEQHEPGSYTEPNPCFECPDAYNYGLKKETSENGLHVIKVKSLNSVLQRDSLQRGYTMRIDKAEQN